MSASRLPPRSRHQFRVPIPCPPGTRLPVVVRRQPRSGENASCRIQSEFTQGLGAAPVRLSLGDDANKENETGGGWGRGPLAQRAVEYVSQYAPDADTPDTHTRPTREELDEEDPPVSQWCAAINDDAFEDLPEPLALDPRVKRQPDSLKGVDVNKLIESLKPQMPHASQLLGGWQSPESREGRLEEFERERAAQTRPATRKKMKWNLSLIHI